MNLADNLKRIRKDNNLSQEQLAEKLNVSRQAVSKWEMGTSYPEMDKVIQICQIFNLNINELINENIKDVNETKDAQVRNNKYVTSFFEYITKTVDMFSSMMFKQKVKCLFEQLIVAFILIVIFGIIGIIGSGLVSSILQILPTVIYYPIYNIVGSLYVIVATIFGTVLLLHIFKTRYLDYYEIVKDDNKQAVDLVEEKIIEVEESKEEKSDKKNKIVLEKKKETIVIRDPKHSEYGFFKGIGKCLLYFVKLMAFIVLVGFVFTLIGLVICLPLSFLVIKNILLFLGLLLAIVGASIINIFILEVIYNFIVSKKFNKNRLFIGCVASLMGFGVGLGLICVSATGFDVVRRESNIVTSEFEFTMDDKIILHSLENWDDSVEYKVKDIDNIIIEVKHSEFNYVSYNYYGDEVNFYASVNTVQVMNYIRDILDGLNNSRINEYEDTFEFIVYANKENLNKIKNNIKEYNNIVSRYESIIDNKNTEIEEKSNMYWEMNDKYNGLIELLENNGFDITYDNNNNVVDVDNYDE